MRSLLILCTLLITSVVVASGSSGYDSHEGKCSCRAPFVDGKKYNIEHKVGGFLLSYCYGCLTQSTYSAIGKELPISTQSYNQWTIVLTGNKATLQMSHSTLPASGGPFTLKAATAEDSGETILTVDGTTTSGKWTVQTHPDKQCAFSLKDEKGRYLCAAKKSHFAYTTSTLNIYKADVATKKFTDNCLFFAYRLN